MDRTARAPSVLVLGGFLTGPPLYWRMRRRLLARGAAAVVIADVWTPDWLLAGIRGLGPIVTRSGRALLAASEISARSGASQRTPLLVIGHSGGGIVGRLLTSPEPFAGRRLGGAGRIGALVTLGTPHHVSLDGRLGHRLAAAAATFADRVVPGAAFAPCTGYVSVGSRGVLGRPDGTGRERVAWHLYQAILPEPGANEIEGDGLVPVRSALLEGSRQIVLDGILHGQGSGRPWYGSDRALDIWWPVALASWRAALDARQVA